MAMRDGKQPPAPAGITLIETLAVIFIVSVLVALLLPAIGLVRERSKRLACSSNLRQMALAVQGYHTLHDQLPALHNGSDPVLPPKYRLVDLSLSWQTLVLPFVEQQALFAQFNYKKQAADPSNSAAVNTVLPLYLCPSTPEREPNIVPTGHRHRFRGLRKFNAGAPRAELDWDLTAAVTDYKPTVEYRAEYTATGRPQLRLIGAWGEIYRDSASLNPYQAGLQRRRRFADVTDGLSNTTLITEAAGLPVSEPISPHPWPDDPPRVLEVIYGAWAVPPMWMFFVSVPTVWGEPDSPRGIINRGNYAGPYAFHPGGVNTAFCDGSVRFLADGLEPDAFAGLLSRDGGEAVAE